MALGGGHGIDGWICFRNPLYVPVIGYLLIVHCAGFAETCLAGSAACHVQYYVSRDDYYECIVIPCPSVWGPRCPLMTCLVYWYCQVSC